MMKTIKFAVLILTMLTINSCGKDEKLMGLLDDYPFYQHSLFLNFQDAEGNNLLEGSEFIWNSVFGMRDTVKPEYYTLDIIFEDGIPNPWIEHYKNPMADIMYPRLYLAKTITPLESLEKSLWFRTNSYKYTGVSEALLYGGSIEECAFAEKIIFRLTCPYLFGDNEAHDIVTWWELHPHELDPSYYYPLCYRIELEGKEFPVEEDTATIILDK